MTSATLSLPWSTLRVRRVRSGANPPMKKWNPSNSKTTGTTSGCPSAETVAMRANADVHVDAETLRDKRAFDFAAQGSLLVDESHLLAAFDLTLWREDWRARPYMAYFNFQSGHFPYDHPGVERRLTAALAVLASAVAKELKSG